MKRNFLIPELSDAINKLEEDSELQTLLIHARKEILDLHKKVNNQPIEDSKTAFKEQVDREVQRLANKLKSKA